MDFYLPLLIHAAKGVKQAVLKRSVFIPKAEGSRSEASSTGPKCIRLEQVPCRRPLSVFFPECTHPEVYRVLETPVRYVGYNRDLCERFKCLKRKHHL